MPARYECGRTSRPNEITAREILGASLDVAGAVLEGARIRRVIVGKEHSWGARPADHKEYAWSCAFRHDYAEASTHYFRHESESQLNRVAVLRTALVMAWPPLCGRRCGGRGHCGRVNGGPMWALALIP